MSTEIKEDHKTEIFCLGQPWNLHIKLGVAIRLFDIRLILYFRADDG